MKSVGLALIGGGVIGRRHLKAIDALNDVHLTCIVDPEPAASLLAGDRGDHSVPWFESVEALTRNSVDAKACLNATHGAIIATPTAHHHQPTLLALDHGLHVLVEKPIMATLAEAQSVIERSAATGLHVLAGHHRRHYDRVHQARDMVRSGTLGKLVAVNGQWTVRKNDAYYDPDWRKDWKAGPVLTNLIHELDTLRYICGEIHSLSADTDNGVQGFEKEDVAALICRFDSGALGTFIISDQTNSPWSWEMATGENAAFPPSNQNAVRFMGTRASLDFPNLVLWEHKNGPGDWNHPISSTDLSDVLEDAYINQMAHFAAVIRGDETPRITAEDATATLRATLAVYEAARSGHRVVLSS